MGRSLLVYLLLISQQARAQESCDFIRGDTQCCTSGPAECQQDYNRCCVTETATTTTTMTECVCPVDFEGGSPSASPAAPEPSPAPGSAGPEPTPEASSSPAPEELAPSPSPTPEAASPSPDSPSPEPTPAGGSNAGQQTNGQFQGDAQPNENTQATQNVEEGSASPSPGPTESGGSQSQQNTRVTNSQYTPVKHNGGIPTNDRTGDVPRRQLGGIPVTPLPWCCTTTTTTVTTETLATTAEVTPACDCCELETISGSMTQCADTGELRDTVKECCVPAPSPSSQSPSPTPEAEEGCTCPRCPWTTARIEGQWRCVEPVGRRRLFVIPDCCMTTVTSTTTTEATTNAAEETCTCQTCPGTATQIEGQWRCIEGDGRRLFVIPDCCMTTVTSTTTTEADQTTEAGESCTCCDATPDGDMFMCNGAPIAAIPACCSTTETPTTEAPCNCEVPQETGVQNGGIEGALRRLQLGQLPACCTTMATTAAVTPPCTCCELEEVESSQFQCTDTREYRADRTAVSECCATTTTTPAPPTTDESTTAGTETCTCCDATPDGDRFFCRGVGTIPAIPACCSTTSAPEEPTSTRATTRATTTRHTFRETTTVLTSLRGTTTGLSFPSTATRFTSFMPTSSSFGATQESTTPGCVCCGGNLVGEGRPTADRPNEPGPPYICRPTGETLQEIPSCCASTTGQIAEEEAETTTTLTETTTTQAATSTETTTETTTSTATTATRTATTTGTTTGTTVVGLPAIPWALNDIDKSLSQTVKEVGANGQCDINTTDLGQQYVCPVNTLKSEGTPVTQELSAKILFTPSFLNSVPAGTVIAMLETKPKLSSRNSLTSDPFDALKGESNQRLATNPFDITMYNPDGTKRVKVQLAEPLVFRLPQKATSENLGDPVCVYLEELPGGGFRWSTEGVRRATAEEVIAAGGNPAGFWCVTNHLSLFAMIAEILLGCLNVELLSPEAMASIGDQPGWYSSRPSVVMWVLLVVLAACCAFGAWRDWDGLLWGRMNAKPKKKKTGPSIMQKIKVLGIRGFVEALFAESSKRGNPQVIAGIQRSLAVRTHVSEKCITANCWNGGAWIDSNSALPHKVLYHKVDYYSRTAEDVLRTELWDSDASGVLYRFGVNFLALHPLLDALRLAGGSMTCAKRVFLLTGTILGTVASNSLIFNFSGAARSWESSVECPLDPASTWFIVLTSLTSVVVNTLPNMTLLIVATKAERRLVWDAAWWVLCLAYVAFTGIIVLTALANLNPLDQRTFHAGLEYALTVKLLLVPLFNTCKASFLLEKVLTEDKSKRRVFMDQFGVIDKRERELDQEARATAQKISNQAITLEQLVNFYSMLGRTVMPDFDPNKSTSYDVVEGGLKTLSLKHESNVDLALGIEVIEVVGVHHSKPSEKAQLACSVLHLGSMKELRRKCIAEYKSPATMANAPGSLQACTWNYSVKLEDADIEQALGFTVIDEGRVMGMACLPVQELVQKQGFEGELMLHDISSDEINASTYKMPAQAGKVGVAATELTGSRQEKKGKLGLSQQTRLKVKVDMPPKFLQALAQKERRKAKDAKPDHHSEVNAEYGAQAELCNILNAESNNPDGTMSASYGAFCEESSLPPDRVVVHSRGGNFLHFVSSVVVDALGDRQKNYDEVRRMLLERDFHGVLDMLNAAGRTGERYWIDMFATDLILGHNVLTGGKDRSHWHEELVAAMPTILRTLKRSCCDILKSDIEARKEPRCRLPVQVLILDPDNELVHTGGSLAEMMIARHAKWNQRLVLHPNHLKGESLSNELQQAQKQLQMKGFDNSLDQPWTHPYLEDKEAVYNTLSELVVGSVKEQMGDTPSIWQDLNLADVYATVGANQISQAVFDGAAGDFAAVAVEE